MNTVLTKVKWVGRATTFAVGLAVILALILGFATNALAAKKAPAVLKNVADQAVTAVTGLKGSLTGAIVKLDNDGSGTALQLEVQPGNAPMTVNSDGKVTNLNADKLDGKDSTAFGIKTAHASARAINCDNNPDPISTFNECAPVTVTVPAGKQYIVSVWSSFSAKGGASNQDVVYCSAGKGSGIELANPCVSPFGAQNKVTVEANQFTASSSSGDTVTLNQGTYTFFTAIKPTAEFADPGGNDEVITKVLVRDSSNSLP